MMRFLLDEKELKGKQDLPILCQKISILNGSLISKDFKVIKVEVSEEKT